MGKRRARKKKKRVQDTDRHRKRGHESGPETTCDQGPASGSCSPAWNSLDEDSLLDYAQNAAANESGDEVEVAKLLSFLNFSVIPCALEPCNLECQPHAQAPTDVDLLSELTSATHHEREADEAGLETDGRHRRENRKRASRRRPNKRAKKLRSSIDDSMCLCRLAREGDLPSAPHCEEDMNSGGCERCWEASTGRGKTRKRSRRERFDPLSYAGKWVKGKRREVTNRSESTTPVNLPTPSISLQCLVDMECDDNGGWGGGVAFSSGTSATCEVDMGVEPESSDHTPPANLVPAMPHELYDDEQSDLSDTTTDR